ncbi:hypothetical protein Enr13x_43260 [Stieleria neptunia]|uniref:Uncharacterized protein n=1 Tax=Stieleria neptunia TaxID=2527979 RepID=A0A518HUC3_9BACT|nr:hypothetical protein [Stieleria neptunia]QDV44460.1 hypothetical protein Enr13x_43260 [Stieleria neptunia]
MNGFIIIEVDDGFTIAEIPEGATPESVAMQRGGVLVEGGPYKSFEEASDVLATLPNPYESKRM